MSADESAELTSDRLIDYFLAASKPRDRWLVGMELERMGRLAHTGCPLPFDGEGASVLKVLNFLRSRRGGEPILEADRMIGLDAPWGTITLEPGGQVEWSSRPQETLAMLDEALRGHVDAMRDAAVALNVRWLDEALDPTLSVADMPWMPKARYQIMRPYLSSRGSLATRMMTQTASIQCAFDFEDEQDWKNKFKTAALLSPVAVALFANSSRVDGRESGYRSYRQVIWTDTDPDRCGLPAIVFDPGFDLQQWVDWVLEVPAIFVHRSHGMAPAGGVPFRELLQRTDFPVRHEDWDTHISTIFTEVRSYTYIEVRSADLLPDDQAMVVPTMWTGLLYNSEALDAAGRLCAGWDDHTAWSTAMEEAARNGLDGTIGSRPIRELAGECLSLAIDGVRGKAACAGDGSEAAHRLEQFADSLKLELRV